MTATAMFVITCPGCGEMVTESRPSHRSILIESRNTCTTCRAARMEIILGRTWRHVVERIGGQRMARWSQCLTTGVWYTTGGWKRPNRAHRLTAEQVAYVESLIGER
jgi:hypothetical protein